MPFGIATQPVQGKHLGVATGRDHCLEERVAFTSTRDHPTQGSAEIYLMNLDGTNAERVTDNLVGDALPDLRPDGKSIVFDSNRLRVEGDSILRSDLFVMKTDGSEQTFLARGSSADWSPDGKSVTFHASASGLTTPIRQDPGGPTIDSDIFIVNVGAALDEGAEPTNITNTPAQIEEQPDWSPDGEKIVYTRFDVGDDPARPTGMEIFVVNADGSGMPDRLTDNSEEERAPAWSPDGTRIVFMCRYGGTELRDLHHERGRQRPRTGDQQLRPGARHPVVGWRGSIRIQQAGGRSQSDLQHQRRRHWRDAADEYGRP